MKNLYLKCLLVCIFSFPFSLSIWSQDYSGQAGPDTLRFYMQNAQYRQAVEYINRLEPNKDLLYQKALCYKNLNDYPRAIEILDTLSEEYPNDIPVKLQLALCYETISQYPKSIDCYNQLLMIDSTNTYFEVQRADLLYRSEKYALALDAYSQIDSTYNPNYITRHLAMCYEKLNQTDIAKDYYAKAWKLNERDAYSANSLVKIQVKKEDYQAAYQNSEKYIMNDSTNSTMNALNAYIYYNLQSYDTAIVRFQKCLQQGDSSLLINRSLGFSYYLTGRDSLARPSLQQASLQDTTNTNILYFLGKANAKLGYYREAIECFQKIIEITVPSDALICDIYKDLAMAQEKSGAFTFALEAYYRALRYAQNNNDKMAIFYALAVLLEYEFKSYLSAIEYYKEYRICLFNYQTSLNNEKEINDVESKLTALDKHIQELKEKSN